MLTNATRKQSEAKVRKRRLVFVDLDLEEVDVVELMDWPDGGGVRMVGMDLSDAMVRIAW